MNKVYFGEYVVNDKCPLLKLESPYKKVGITELSIKRRHNESGTPVVLKIIKCWKIKNHHEIENELKEVFKNEKVLQEWFLDPDDLLLDILCKFMEGKGIEVDPYKKYTNIKIYNDNLEFSTENKSQKEVLVDFYYHVFKDKTLSKEYLKNFNLSGIIKTGSQVKSNSYCNIVKIKNLDYYTNPGIVKDDAIIQLEKVISHFKLDFIVEAT